VRSQHGIEPKPMLIADFTVCWSNLAEAETLARRHMGSFVQSNIEHYELMSDHFASAKGYNAYAQKSEIARKTGVEGMTEGFMKAAVWGPPDRILRELESRRATVGAFELATSFRFGGIPYDVAEQSLRLFAQEVLPVLKDWKYEAMMAAAAE